MPGENETQNQSTQTTQTQPEQTQQTETQPRRSLLNEQAETKTVATGDAQQTPEQKAEAERLEADKGKKPSGAPEKYEPFKAPEGYEIDEKVAGEASVIFRELGLSQEAAQKLVDFQGKLALGIAEAPYKEWADTQDTWVKEVKAEHGSKLDSVRASIGRAIDQLGPELGQKFRDAMDFTGAGNNPAFVNALAKWSSLLGEGSTVRGNGPTDGSPPGAKPSIAQAMYPTLPSAAKG